MDDDKIKHCDCGCDGCEGGCDCGDDEIITLTDDEGVTTDFVIFDAVEYKGALYFELVEAAHAEDDECEFIILKGVDSEGDSEEGVLTSIDDEDELDAVLKLFDEKAQAEGEYGIEETEEE